MVDFWRSKFEPAGQNLANKACNGTVNVNDCPAFQHLKLHLKSSLCMKHSPAKIRTKHGIRSLIRAKTVLKKAKLSKMWSGKLKEGSETEATFWIVSCLRSKNSKVEKHIVKDKMHHKNTTAIQIKIQKMRKKD